MNYTNLLLFILIICVIINTMKKKSKEKFSSVKFNKHTENFSSNFEDAKLFDEDIQRRVNKAIDDLKLPEKVNNKLSSLNTKVTEKLDGLNVKVNKKLEEEITKNTAKVDGAIKNIPKTLGKQVAEKYKVDIEAIRNLSHVATKLQSGGLTIPGNLKIKGSLTVDKDASVMNNLYVKDHISSKRLDIRNTESVAGRGWTHFNHDNKGLNYIRGPLQVDQGNLTTNGGMISNGQMTTKNINSNGDITTNNLTSRGDIRLNTNLVFEGTNRWIMHTPNDGRHIMYIAPSKHVSNIDDWQWGQGAELHHNNHKKFHGDTEVTGTAYHATTATHKLRPRHHCNWVDHGCVSRSLDSAGAARGDVVPMKWNHGSHHHIGGFISHERRSDSHLYERGSQLHGSYHSHRREHNGHGHMRR